MVGSTLMELITERGRRIKLARSLRLYLPLFLFLLLAPGCSDSGLGRTG